MLIVNQTGNVIYNVDHIKEIFLSKGVIYVGDVEISEPIYQEQTIPAAIMFEAIIKAAATGATVIRLDKHEV